MGRITSSLRQHLTNWNIDTFLNPYIPPNPLSHLPTPISHFLGYRSHPPKEAPSIIQWPVTFLATVAALCLVSGIGNYGPEILKYHPPVIIASLGASAILDFGAIASPLAQPRNSIIGNTLAALCGVAIAKLFQLSPQFEGIMWVSGAVGCAVAGLVMSVTGTVHPPGGATAVLASTEMHVLAMGWPYVGIVLMDSTLMVCVALLFNNVFRRYPLYWWTPGSVGGKLREERAEKAEMEVEEMEKKNENGGDEEKGKVGSDTSSDRTLKRELSHRVEVVEGLEGILVKSHSIQVPKHARLSEEEVAVLSRIQERLRVRME
ncbi:related to HPP family protein [Ramularia collo-cygni]|uniref:Related to HPP family protein n=1 Tax=Ramularia collo-cygni TaxID=112498 RepID=A0A2D3V3F6_9PEZI|nr:related to HPP family protein [Ramularia collo-cygni]CZT21225.1 related to HPP family protein [Ramularia collo-cygni]